MSTSWPVFLKAHRKAIAASEFFTVERWSGLGLMTHHVLWVIERVTRGVALGGVTSNPLEAWRLYKPRNLLDRGCGALVLSLVGQGHGIVNRDTKYSSAFWTVLAGERIEVIRPPPRSAILDAYAARFGCASTLMPSGAPMHHRALREHRARNHPGLDNPLITPRPVRRSDGLRIKFRSRLAAA